MAVITAPWMRLSDGVFRIPEIIFVVILKSIL